MLYDQVGDLVLIVGDHTGPKQSPDPVLSGRHLIVDGMVHSRLAG